MDGNTFTREQLHAYLDDALSDAETARIEQALRSSDEVRRQLQSAREERERGEHSLGAIWQRERLSCLTREQWSSHLHGLLEPELQKYAEFHLTVIGCATCRANLDDIRERQADNPGPKRRRKIVDSGSKLLEDLSKEERPG